MKRFYYNILAAAILLSVAVALLIQFGYNWEHPSRSRGIAVFDGNIPYNGATIHLAIRCNCPSFLPEGKTQSASFQFTLLKTNPTSSRSGVAPPEEQAPAAPSSAGRPRDLFVSLEQPTGVKGLDGEQPLDLGPDSMLGPGINQDLSMTVEPAGTGPVKVPFHFRSAILGSDYDMDLGQHGAWEPEIRPGFVTAMLPFLAAFLICGLILAISLYVARRQRALQDKTDRQLNDLTAKLADRADQSHFAWESARIKLEAYFDRNLIQVNLVFWAAILVMTVGFIFVVAGLMLSFRNPEHLATSALAAGCGVITQFIGATFIVIYQSIMNQAKDFMRVLEKINTVGMAVSELDQIPEASGGLKNEVRAKFVSLLLNEQKSASPQASEPSRSVTA